MSFFITVLRFFHSSCKCRESHEICCGQCLGYHLNFSLSNNLNFFPFSAENLAVSAAICKLNALAVSTAAVTYFVSKVGLIEFIKNTSPELVESHIKQMEEKHGVKEGMQYDLQTAETIQMEVNLFADGLGIKTEIDPLTNAVKIVRPLSTTAAAVTATTSTTHTISNNTTNTNSEQQILTTAQPSPPQTTPINERTKWDIAKQYIMIGLINYIVVDLSVMLAVYAGLNTGLLDLSQFDMNYVDLLQNVSLLLLFFVTLFHNFLPISSLKETTC